MVSFNLKNNIPKEVFEWFKENDEGELISMTAVGGGCINNGVSISTQSGNKYFLKSNINAPEDMFIREAEGLELLSVDGGPQIPNIYLVGKDFLLLEYFSSSSKYKNYWGEFGSQLATIHQKTNSKFGLEKNNYIGSTKQINIWTEDGFEFYATNRLIYQSEIATRQSFLTTSEELQITNIAKRLPELLPVQKAALIHGDLWSGNVINGLNGEPAIIDPAVYYGWVEAELAMTTLFGDFPNEFYENYINIGQIEPNWRDRKDIYNLYHLLNHLNIFGMSYHGRVKSILNKYS